MKATTEKKVLRLLRMNECYGSSYAILCCAYWSHYNKQAFESNNILLMTSPESICRAFRALVSKGLFTLSKESVIMRKKNERAYRAFYRGTKVII